MMLPQFDIVAVDELPCSLNGGSVVRAVQIDSFLDTVVAVDKVGSVISHVPTLFRRLQSRRVDPLVDIGGRVGYASPLEQGVPFGAWSKFGRLRLQVVREKPEPIT